MSNNVRQDSADTVKPIFHTHFLDSDVSDELCPEHTSKSLSRISAFKSPPNTPAARTGPPRSLSFVYSLPNSPSIAKTIPDVVDPAESDLENSDFGIVHTDFRGALEHAPQYDRKGKRRERRYTDDSWNVNPMKWFHGSPKDEPPPIDFPVSSSAPDNHQQSGDENTRQQNDDRPDILSSTTTSFLRLQRRRGTSAHDSDTLTSPAKPNAPHRAFSVPDSPVNPEREKDKPSHPESRARWSKLRSLLPHVIRQNETTLPGPSPITPQAVNITDELITGGLSTLMLRLWFERDEKGHRRVPVLFHRLKLRISDSLHPMQGHKSVFRIECEYANGAARWVIYRELMDFLSLHAHYTVSNVYNRNVDKMPEFPKTSLPYFKFLKKQGKEKGDRVGRADFARLQREALENYLLDLIRAVMFHPSSNRLAGFLEISALSIALAQSGGAQCKAGFLSIESVGGGFGRRSASWKARKEQRWCAIRESYLVALEEPGELAVWDVFLLDTDFEIQRPVRAYRQGLGALLHHETGKAERGDADHAEAEKRVHAHLNGLDAPALLPTPEADKRSVILSIRKSVSKIFRLEPCLHPHTSSGNVPVNGQTQGVDHASDADLSDTASTNSDGSIRSTALTPMLDPSTNANPIITLRPSGEGNKQNGIGNTNEKANEQTNPKPEGEVAHLKKRAAAAGDVSKHTFYIVNSQMKLKIFARNERQMLQFITALEKLKATSHYVKKNRFDSFAPIRLNVAAQWLVDGRDYFWNFSRAILLAKESIYIHDWWLSPELLMRRPGKDRYRLDRLLERKAKEGVKIYIILYLEVSNRTTPTDSSYAKQRLTGLHPNVMVQRSPSHFQTGTFYWAHHEKMCVIDQTIAFMGGLDLSYGRWDTPQHVLTDDMVDTERSEIWPGKDYSNPRVSDFYNLNKPEENMYDRSKVPRMPWHDVGMQIVGQPARDLARHFVQRWNYLLRIKNHSRVMPFLLPPPEFKPGELTQIGLTGTCELQICRSAGPWSLGTPGRIEHSIQTAYLKAIQMSEHFVYIENQFFITSTVVNDVKIENNIGDAIVHRIIRAHKDRTPWKCCIVIPLLPGFTFPVDHSDASAVRIILECQSRTIARGPNSIFSRLRKEGINPDDYISVFSLRNWAKMRGDVLTTEQVYIHGKVCIVDDRLAIIGSANINERSQRGDRDSELAAVIRDTDLIDSTMAGQPFKVGRFAHTLRVRLMQEHLGIDVDALDEDDLMAHESLKQEYEQDPWDPDQEEGGANHAKQSKQQTPTDVLSDENITQVLHVDAESPSAAVAKVLHKMGIAKDSVAQGVDGNALEGERKEYDSQGQKQRGFAITVAPTLEEKTTVEQRPPREQVDKDIHSTSPQDQSLDLNCRFGQESERNGDAMEREQEQQNWGIPELRLDEGLLPMDAKPVRHGSCTPSRSLHSDVDEVEQDILKTTIRNNLGAKPGRTPWTVPTPRPKVGPQDFEDPISDAFWKNIWVASAVHNTEIYRKVFRAIPDDLITTWKQYKEFVVWHDRLNKPTRDGTTGEPVARMPSESGDETTTNTQGSQISDAADMASQMSREGEDASPATPLPIRSTATPSPAEDTPPKARRPAKGSEPFEKWERDEMEQLLLQLNGHLVLYPNRFLEGEDVANNFLFNADKLLPLPIYT